LGETTVKTYRNLYPRVYAWENLELAYRKARRGKRAKRPAADFEFERERNLVEGLWGGRTLGT
jgi:hypothetical protein